MELICLGINHRTAPVDIREKMWFSTDELRSFLPRLHSGDAEECVLVSTCNRTELYYVPKNDKIDPWNVWIQMTAAKPGAESMARDHFYVIPSFHAVKHLFNVTAAADSMILGDVQIIGQVKEAFQLAGELRTTGILLNRLFTSALHLGKRVRTETEIGEGAISVSYAAAELAGKIFEDLSRRTALLIGAGETGELAAKHLCSRRLGRLRIANRTRERAENLARQLGGEAIDFSTVTEALHDVDILISSVTIDGYLFTADDLRRIVRLRGGKPLFIIDIGVPRNIDPGANTIETIFLNDIDALNHIIDNNLVNRLAEIPRVRMIIWDELVKFHAWHSSLEVAPTIELLRDQFEAIRREEVEKHRQRFPVEKQEDLEILTRRIVNKILHTPMVNLRNNAGPDAPDQLRNKLHLLRYLFGLDKKQ